MQQDTKRQDSRECGHHHYLNYEPFFKVATMEMIFGRYSTFNIRFRSNVEPIGLEAFVKSNK